jgi:hypothetical protein
VVPGWRCLVMLVHLLFIIFVVGGAYLASKWPRIVWAHLPAALYGAMVESIGFTCPLTLLENDLRHLAGDAGYSGGFVYRVGRHVRYRREAVDAWLEHRADKRSAE